ncbi:HAD family hydrolase [Pectobacterium brasiliense]|uniref:HAD family hydrolase n=1 Tax=Pectobacterium brasiliense TaxID=180957 RepID=UPI000ABC379A|nr:HAD-IA family hydrolase [Pectobacterium brasiliense]MDG0805720.1 HAD-IA family hydrolase [Pectobacterium brasiliense]
MTKSKPIKKVLITDLDNTLFDWFNVWYESFNAMLEQASKISGISKAELIPQIKKIHQRHGTAEYSFLLEEIPDFLKVYNGAEEIRKVMSPAVNIYRKEREKNLKLYETVYETLVKLRQKGVLIVGYTESKAYYSSYRLTKLGLDGVLDFLYSPEDHSVPGNKSQDQTFLLKETIHLHTPLGETKPNPDILLQIISDIGATPEECVYIGDSEMKDIDMAKLANVSDVFAAYGTNHFGGNEEKYDLLRAVTHWTQADVDKEKLIKSNYNRTEPSYTIQNFSELLNIFNFSNFKSSKPPAEKGAPLEKLKLEVEIWKTAIDVQKHFNDMSMRVKHYAILMLTAFLGAIGFIYKNQGQMAITIDGHAINLTGILGVVAILVWNLIFFMDYIWYHPMLKGSVMSALSIEERLRFDLPTLNLTKTIGEHSHKYVLFDKPFNSNRKAMYFYNGVTITLSILTVCLFMAG